VPRTTKAREIVIDPALFGRLSAGARELLAEAPQVMVLSSADGSASPPEERHTAVFGFRAQPSCGSDPLPGGMRPACPRVAPKDAPLLPAYDWRRRLRVIGMPSVTQH